MSLSGNVDLLAGRIAEEFNTVRQEIGQLGTRSTTSSSSIDADNHDIVDLTLTANVTLSVPIGGATGSAIQVFALASGGQRTLTFDATYLRLDGIAASYDIAQGKVLRAALRKHGSNWIVEAVGVTQ